MKKDLLLLQLKKYEEDYKKFMDIEEFPAYKLQTREVSLSLSDMRGFEVAASTHYLPQEKQHSLLISTNLRLIKYLMFHEFTHMLDAEMYVRGDKSRYAGLSGYTEYHASQVELVQLLGANSINETEQFSMNTIIRTLAGEKTVHQYVEEKYNHAITLFSRADFPADINTLKSALGVLFNYYGLRSICEMYAVDYEEVVDNEAFIKFIPTQLFVMMNNLMHGWMDEEKIEKSILVYVNIIYPLVQEYRLV